MTAPELEPRVIADGLRGPDGPAFDAEGHLWCVETHAGTLVRRDAQTGAVDVVSVGGAPVALAIDAYGRVWFSDDGYKAIRRHDPHDGQTVTLISQIDAQPLARPRGLAFDTRGNMVFTCLGETRAEPTGYVCCAQPGGLLEMIANELCAPTALAFLHGGQALIVAEATKRRLWMGDWACDDCTWTHERVWSRDLDEPQGLAIGVDGNAYVALSGGAAVRAINPDGLIVDTHLLPGRTPTGCAFDPTGNLGLVVADAARGELLSIPGLGTGLPLYDGGSAWSL